MDVSVPPELRYLTRGSRVPVAQRQSWVLPEASGDRVEVIAPFGGAEDMVRELKAAVFPGREVRYTRLGPQGKTVEVV